MRVRVSVTVEGEALTDVGHSLTRELSVSWLGWGFQHSTDPKKFGEAGTVVLSALKAHESGAKDD